LAIEKIAVIGSGLMGHGIAQVAATSGQEVFLIDVSDELLAKAVQKIEGSLNKLSEKGRIQESPAGILKRIKTTTSIPQGVGNVDYVVEAVPEDIGLKKKILSEADLHAPKDTILATNTSGLSITIIAEATKRREKVIGMHWMNPPQIMRLVEIITSKYTDREALQITVDLCERYGKESLVAQKDVWFFLVNRSRAGLSIESSMMYLRQEADFKEIDAVIRYRIGLPMGEFELTDFTGGADIRPKSLQSAEEILKIYPEFEPWPMLTTVYRHVAKKLWSPMSEKGLSGVKTGKGFYTYPEGKYVKPEIPEELAGKVEPIQLLAPTINIAARCVSDGVGSIEDINKSFILAFGWPKGIFEFVGDFGVDDIKGILKAKEEKAPEHLRDFYRVDPLLANWAR
jgi:enoyl-CoA hydratase/3-hydroxyacyl-CoA dehydrogenase